METSNYTIYYVTSKGSVKGPKGVLLHPGDVFPSTGRTDEQMQALFEGGTICTDPAESFTVPDQEQTPLPESKAGSDEATVPPATGVSSNDTAARKALRAAKQADKEAVEILGHGPVRRHNDEILPVTATDPSNVTTRDDVTIKDLAGKNLSVDEFRAMKN